MLVLCHNWGDFEGHDERDVCVLKLIILNLTLGIQGSDPHTYKSTGCSLQIPYQCRSRFRFSNTDKNIPFKLNISSHCVAHGLKRLFCVILLQGEQDTILQKEPRFCEMPDSNIII